jgi:hypothetical protein
MPTPIDSSWAGRPRRNHCSTPLPDFPTSLVQWQSIAHVQDHSRLERTTTDGERRRRIKYHCFPLDDMEPCPCGLEVYDANAVRPQIAPLSVTHPPDLANDPVCRTKECATLLEHTHTQFWWGFLCVQMDVTLHRPYPPCAHPT